MVVTEGKETGTGSIGWDLETGRFLRSVQDFCHRNNRDLYWMKLDLIESLKTDINKTLF